ncbi:conjugal transfer protein [Streptomyces sp. NPDC058739]|uniref:conjugal transfer protein n=1 Tax=Streptomyces sp. NPDC058739 TaxID=3346618 RepID=UPI0036A4FE2B
MPLRKRAPQDQAATASCAGARLHTMRRRSRLTRLAVWTVIAAGPAALALTVTTTPATVQAASPPPPTTVRTAVAADPGGYAQVFLRAWLHGSAGDAGSARARLAQSMAPDVALPDPATGARTQLESVTAVRSARHRGGGWSVTVVAQDADGTVRYFAVPVAADSSGSLFTVTGAPAVVAGPVRAETPPSPYTVDVPDGELATAVGEFLAAYLTGAGGIDRYLAPGVSLAPVSPAPYTAVSVRQVSAAEETAAAEDVPADGTRVRVQAAVEARDGAGRWPLSYDLDLTARSGRWEIAGLPAAAASGKAGAR